MISKHEVEKQLRAIDAMPKFFGRPEVRELPRILFEGEIIRHMTVGRYEGGWATLCATDRRILLVDKKPFYLTIEDIRYDMVSEVQYDHRLLDASVRLGTVHKTISFLSYSRDRLRDLTTYAQEQVMHVRAQPGQATEPSQATVLRGDELSEDAEVSLRGVSTVLSEARPRRGGVLRPLNPYRAPIIVRKRVSRFYES
ncbi:PH domain-containing protein [Candidatus Saccharibacteria bacterium]|nr:PH domain-containing protein [Candidatus Saccharibacteria bacterium]